MRSFQFKRSYAFVLTIAFYLCFQTVTYANTAKELTILVPNFPPYTFLQDNSVKGIGIDLATKIFTTAGLSVNFQLMPNYGKVVYNVAQNKGDGFLLASQNQERDKIAAFTKPLLINRWCWFTLKQTEIVPDSIAFKKQAKVSTHFNTNTHKWLDAQNYSVEAVMDVKVLPEMLIKKRVDAVFIAELVFEQALAENGYSMDLFDKFIEVEKPFGIYISHSYLKENPETINQLNQAIIKHNLPAKHSIAAL